MQKQREPERDRQTPEVKNKESNCRHTQRAVL